MTKPLPHDSLRAKIDPESLGFATTDDITPLAKPLGQERAVSAITFGLEIGSHGYNLFVLGHPGAGKFSTVKMVVEDKAATGDVPDDWCYVFNFADAEKPVAIDLPPGKGEVFRDGVAALVKSLLTEIPKVYSDENYNREKADFFSHGQEKRNEVFDELGRQANLHGFLLQRNPDGLTLSFARDGVPIEPDEFGRLSPEEQDKVKESREVLHEKMREAINTVKSIDQAVIAAVEELDKKLGLALIDHLLEPLRAEWAGRAKIMEYLDAIRADVMANLDKFRAGERETPKLPFPLPFPTDDGPEETVKRYRVNLLVSGKGAKAAPVVFESNPSYHNLIGRIEHRAQLGAFFTDYTMIKAGAFHRANGGYLVLNAREVLLNPFAYEALKRVLKDQEIRMEEVGEQYRMIATVTLKPEPIPARLKVILLGTPWLYYLLQMYDEDFLKLFKVKGEFADEMALSGENLMSYAYLISSQCSREGLLPFDAAGVAAVMEHGMRLAENQKKLSTRFLEITDLVREAHHWAKRDEAQGVDHAHVEKALKHAVYRNDYLEELIGEMIEDGTILIDVEGSVVGQVNGLSVFELGDYSFGKPSRVTARVHMGKEGVTNIERESEMGGPIHNKGVMILQGFFGARYALKTPLSLAATLCFEQSYGGVEGDSASSAELFALISAVANVPLRQDVAVTGSVNQMGRIQAIGGVNQKIEGFYRTCKKKGLTGTQGVIIPASNARNLMLDSDVVDAVKEGRFAIYPISTVDEGIALLTGQEPGEADQYGDFPKGSVNGKVVARLMRITEQWKKLHED